MHFIYLQVLGAKERDIDPEHTEKVTKEFWSPNRNALDCHDLNLVDDVFHQLKTRLEAKSCQIEQEVKTAVVPAAKGVDMKYYITRTLQFILDL